MHRKDKHLPNVSNNKFKLVVVNVKLYVKHRSVEHKLRHKLGL
jgi:hypothetical protein